MPPKRTTHTTRTTRSNAANPNNSVETNIAEVIAQQLAELVPNIVSQVAALMHQDSVNNPENNPETQTNNNPNAGGNHNGQTTGCNYKEFLACKPKEFDGKGGALAVTRWVEKMEAVIDISKCSNQDRVRFATSSLVNKALTWWNTQLQARGRESAMGMTWEDFKALLSEEFCPLNEMKKLEDELWDHTMVGANHAAYTDRFHELAKLVPRLVTPESKRIERYINGLHPEIRRTVRATEPATIQSAILKAGALTDDMVKEGRLVKTSEKKKDAPESSKQGSQRNKKAKVETDNNPKSGYSGPAPKCEKCGYHHFATSPCRICTNCNRSGHLAKDCRSTAIQAVPRNAFKPGACYECGSLDHFRNACPKLNRTPGTNENRPNPPLLTYGNQGQGGKGNQPRGRAFVMGVNEACQDPNIVTGTFSLNNQFATVLFDSGADYSFISVKFMSLLDSKPSTSKFQYLVELANGRLIKTNKILKGCVLVLENIPFSIDLLPFELGSFDVVVGMDWLSKHEALIVCHEKKVRIPLPNGSIIEVQGELTNDKKSI